MSRHLLRARERNDALGDEYRAKDCRNSASSVSITHPRLRRIKAYSALAVLGASARCLGQKEELNHGIGKASMSLVENHELEIIPHELFTQPPLESTDATVKFGEIEETNTTSIFLHRKRKSEDLRTSFTITVPDSKDIIRGGASPDPDTASMNKTINSQDCGTQQPLENVYCVCRRAFDATQGEMVMCEICNEWFHLRCVGHCHRNLDFFEERAFFCPDCETAAFQELAAEELKIA